MARFAVGDIQGCHAELRALLNLCRFRSDRDELWFVGDLVNRGPDSLGVLRFVRSLGDNAMVVLGNHDLHLLAVALGGRRKLRPDDTLDAVLAAPDRDALLEWLLTRPLAHHDPEANDLLIHAGILPQWSVAQVMQLASTVSQELQSDPRSVFGGMYGNQPDRWNEHLRGADRRRVVINALTRMRFCTADGRIDLALKNKPDLAGSPGLNPDTYLPWFKVPQRASQNTRVIFGHWSTLGWYDGDNVVALDTGCVWGGALTAVRLDESAADGATHPATRKAASARWSLPCIAALDPGGD